MRGHVEIVKFLLQKQADRSIRNKQDKIPMDLCQPCWSDSYRYTRQVPLISSSQPTCNDSWRQKRLASPRPLGICSLACGALHAEPENVHHGHDAA